ncbi:hypothetical protein [Microbacterium pygmaeum]|uniref:Uncharacterized protein n=1 Tax=Microbacterium pygmaeum TaxID=370764 RepID=A0A1G8BK62_9MICO|nr:hypothetical protein [Microbacterium pygmaeum]SDH33612.1 hypothetical protein SAMN04489810_2834 [Microbacterium pygmaeum]
MTIAVGESSAAADVPDKSATVAFPDVADGVSPMVILVIVDGVLLVAATILLIVLLARRRRGSTT